MDEPTEGDMMMKHACPVCGISASPPCVSTYGWNKSQEKSSILQKKFITGGKKQKGFYDSRSDSEVNITTFFQHRKIIEKTSLNF